jgi:hypothetical protein
MMELRLTASQSRLLKKLHDLYKRGELLYDEELTDRERKDLELMQTLGLVKRSSVLH